MGTRGAVGFVVNGKLKMAYNHFDSYPSGLGNDVVEFLIGLQGCFDSMGTDKHPLDKLKSNADKLILIDTDKKPTEAEKKLYAKFADLKVSDQSLDDWYCLLRNFQSVDGLKGVLSGDCQHWADSNEFPEDSLFCEWAYVIDLDKDQLEFYKGFQKKAHAKGRFAKAKHKEGEYYPCKLVATLPFKDLEKKWPALMKKMEK